MMKTVLGILLVFALGLGIMSKVLLTHLGTFVLAFVLTPAIMVWTLVEVLFKAITQLGTIEWKKVLAGDIFKKRITDEH